MRVYLVHINEDESFHTASESVLLTTIKHASVGSFIEIEVLEMTEEKFSHLPESDY